MFNFFKQRQNKYKGRLKNGSETDKPVLLAETDRMHADMIEPILKDSGIPYERRGTLGAAVTLNAGTILETYRFYVPCGAYGKCRELLSGIIK